jgi:TetR/AcrR family transcriptional regulator
MKDSGSAEIDSGNAATRDPRRTQERILASALKEFSAKGFSGARVDAIARRAAINKRMLYHYFGDKEGLFREVLRQKMAQRAAWLAASPMDPIELLPYWFDLACKDPEWIRLLEWEALQGSDKKVIHQKKRREAMASAVVKIRRRQQLGLLSKELDPRHVLLSHMALTMFPLAFPQITRLITGFSVSDPRFQKARSEFLRKFSAALRINRRGKRSRPSRGNNNSTNGRTV